MTEAVAHEILDRVLEVTGQKRLSSENARKFSGRWFEARHNELSAISRYSYENAIRMLLDHLGVLADKLLGTITAKHIEIFKASGVAVRLAAKPLIAT